MRGVLRELREFAAAALGFGSLAIALTYPLSFHLRTLARTDSFDAQFSIWNVAWVARAMVTNPRDVLNANIFYPRPHTLVYSEANLAAGVLAAPAYWLTGNAYAAHNFVVVLSFALSAIAMYYFARYLAGDRRAAVIAAIAFAFAPHVFSHLPHIQLLMTAGIPLALLAFHRLADRPSAGRGIALGLAMAAEAYACAYYSIFVMLMVALATLMIAASRSLWRSPRYWVAIAIAAAVAMIVTFPLAHEYMSLQRATGFERSLAEGKNFSADWRAYLASSAYAHQWMLPLLGRWMEVLFPGFVALGLGAAGAALGWRSGARDRELVMLYGALAVLAFWASFGPAGALYSGLYSIVPGFTFLRAPSRFGLVVVFALSVLAAIGVARLLARVPRPNVVFGVLLALAVAEGIEPLAFRPVPPPAPAYRLLAHAPRGAVLELPVYSNRFAFMRVRYMLASTAHWQPLVNAYSDYMPQDFVETEGRLGHFPSEESFALLKRDGVRYALFHVNEYKGAQFSALLTRLDQFRPYLRRLYADDRMWLYEVVGYP